MVHLAFHKLCRIARSTRAHINVQARDPLRTCAIPERLRGVFTTIRRSTNPRLPYLTLPYLTTFVKLYKNF